MLRPRAFAHLLGSAVLVLTLAPAQASSSRDRAADPPLNGRAARAVAALERVEDRTGDRTLALRDLALLRDDLPADLRRRAASYLSRPTADPARCPDLSCYATRRVHRACTAAVCVHYVRRAADPHNGVPTADRDRDRRPDYVERVLASVTHVHRTYVAAGYRPPVADGTRGGDARTDVYLAQLGDESLYGYCTTDQSDLPLSGATWAYCVLDNDYRAQEFPAHTPLRNMRVTAAHEYFHAVQFGYDIGEDAWFMEATATWVEDEVYDRVDDNVSFLPHGPVGRPASSLDSHRDGYYYGAWIFFRHLSEQFPEADGGLPVLVRSVWQYADATPLAPDRYSLTAIEQALADRGSSTGAAFARMAADNLHPRRWYDEGAHYPRTELAGTRTLTATRPLRRLTLVQDHLTSASYRFEPGAGLGAPDWQLRLTLDLAPTLQGSRAIARVILRSGRVRTVVPELSPEGDHTGVLPFSRAEVRAVEVTVANASTRYRCDRATGWSCHGRPLDQDVRQALVVRAERASD